jgi:hypothetical protein
LQPAGPFLVIPTPRRKGLPIPCVVRGSPQAMCKPRDLYARTVRPFRQHPGAVVV